LNVGGERLHYGSFEPIGNILWPIRARNISII